MSSLYIGGYPAHRPSSVLSGKTETDIKRKVGCAIEEEKGLCN